MARMQEALINLEHKWYHSMRQKDAEPWVKYWKMQIVLSLLENTWSHRKCMRQNGFREIDEIMEHTAVLVLSREKIAQWTLDKAKIFQRNRRNKVVAFLVSLW